MKHTLRTLTLIVVIILMTSTANANPQQEKFRVVLQSTLTNATGHGHWVSKDAAFADAWSIRAAFLGSKIWIQEKRSLFFIPLPPKHLPLTNVFQSTAGMKVGDTVRYHLPEWKIDKTRKGKIEGLSVGGWVLSVDGKAMGVSCVTEHFKVTK